MSDYIIKATAGEGSIRAFAALTTETVEEAKNIHNTTSVATAAIGRLLTAGALMGSMIKENNGLITLQIKGDGPIGGIVVTADNIGNVKGYLFNPSANVPNKSEGKLNVGGAVGKGTLTVIKDIGLKEPYAGQCELVNGEIAEDLTYYFAESEQTPSSVALGVLVGKDRSVLASGGFIIQVMPDADEKSIDLLETKLATIPYITQMLSEGITPEGILEMILGNMDLNITEKIPVRYHCGCTRERVERALISIGLNDLKQIAEEDKKTTLSCHFCNKSYDFSEEQLKCLIDELSK